MYLIEFEEVKEKIVFQLINQQSNKELLQKAPHILYLDMAIVFCIYDDRKAMIIKEKLKKLWDVTTEILYRIAKENTETLLPSSFSTIEEVLRRLTDEEIESEEQMMYILSNRWGIFGAACILYPGKLKEIGKRLKEDYFVIPSSIHEVIIVPKSKAIPKEDLDAMIQEINETQVEAVDVLSNHAYYYDRKKDELVG